MVGVAYRRRVLTSRGHSITTKWVALLSYVRNLILNGIQVSLVGDCKFGSREPWLVVPFSPLGQGLRGPAQNQRGLGLLCHDPYHAWSFGQ
jgi:hypothetical protein